MKKRIVSLFVALVLVFSLVPSSVFTVIAQPRLVADVTLRPGDGDSFRVAVNGFDVNLWSQKYDEVNGVMQPIPGIGSATMRVFEDGTFVMEWDRTQNVLVSAGYLPAGGADNAPLLESFGDVSMAFSLGEIDISDGGGYVSVYGWTWNRTVAGTPHTLIEWYIIDDWYGDNRPYGWHNRTTPGPIPYSWTGHAYFHGTVEIDGDLYDIITDWRVHQPSISPDGFTTFMQIKSVRHNSRSSGTISISEHWQAWEEIIGTQQAVTDRGTFTARFDRTLRSNGFSMLIESFQSQGGHAHMEHLCMAFAMRIACSTGGCDHCNNLDFVPLMSQPRAELYRRANATFTNRANPWDGLDIRLPSGMDWNTNDYVITVRGRVLNASADTITRMALNGQDAPWSWQSTSVTGSGNFEIVGTMGQTFGVVNPQQFANGFRVQTVGCTVDFVVDSFTIERVGEAPTPTVTRPAGQLGITINGVAQNFNPPPMEIGGSMMLPFRAIGEALGMNVSSSGGVVTLTAPGVNATHVARTNVITVNGTAHTFAAPSTAVEGRLLMPLRMFSAIPGITVRWDSPTRTAVVTTE